MNIFAYCLLVFISFATQIATAQNFKFALITDIHVKKDSSAYVDLTRTINDINKNPNIEFVLVTGDLTEEGDRVSLQRVKNALDNLKAKYYAVSGNHETKWSESGATDFKDIFGCENFKLQHNGYTFLGFNTGPIIRMMDGHVAPQDIAWLDKEFKNAAPNTRFIIVTHYPLKDGDVDNWYEVTDLIRQYNTKAVLGGHYHSNRLAFYDGIPGFINRSNLRDKSDNTGGYSIYEITQDSILVSEKKIDQDPIQWGGYSLTTKYYDTNNSQYKRPSDSINTVYPNVHTKWVKNLGSTLYSSPLMYKNDIYVGDDAGTLYCLSVKNGDIRWTFKSGNRILGTPDAKDDILVFGSTDKNIYGINTKTGKEIWRITAIEPVLGATTIDENLAYIGASDNTMRAIDIKTGAIKWVFDHVKGYIETKPLIYQNMLIFGAWDNTMYALDKKTGSLIWKWSDGKPGLHFSPAAVWPVAANDKIFFTAPDRVMTAVDAKTGETVWRTNESMVRETIGLSEDNSRVYSKTMQDNVVCYSTEGNTPERIWNINVGYGYDHAASMPVEKDNVVFGSTKNGIIFAIDPIKGELLWVHKVGNSLVNTVVPINKNECIFSSTQGTVGILSSK